jgi:hypothetical protein
LLTDGFDSIGVPNEEIVGWAKARKRYAYASVGAVHNNTIEGFWSIFKRGVIGTFHKVSEKYLPLYVAEFQFRYDNRHNADIFSKAISGC